MIVNRHDQNDAASVMTIYLRNADANANSPADATTQPPSSRSNMSKAQAASPSERIVQIDMKNKHSSHILEYLLAETRAVPSQPTTEEIAEMQDLEALRKQADYDRTRVRQVREEKKREEDMLKRARAAGGLSEEDAA